MKEAESCKVPSSGGFATSLKKDLAAVKARPTECWSNGPVEKFVHKLQLIERQGYGRANLDLFKARRLAA